MAQENGAESTSDSGNEEMVQRTRAIDKDLGV